MKKSLLTIGFGILLIYNQTFAQEIAFEEEKNYVSFSYGIGAFYSLIFETIKEEVEINQLNSNISTSSLGPISFKYEKAISDEIGLGLTINYLSNELKYTNYDNPSPIYYNLKRSTFSILGRINYHYAPDLEKFDPYAGFGIGYRTEWWKNSVTNSGNNSTLYPDLMVLNFPLGLEAVMGARYYFFPNIAAMVEVGIAKSVLQFGITGKF